MSTPIFNDFFNNTNPSKWSCENVVKYYREYISQHEPLKKVLYDINIEFKRIKETDSDDSRRKTAQYIIDNWKVRAYLDNQGMVKLGHTRSTGYERKVRAYLDLPSVASWDTQGRPYWTMDVKQSNQNDEIIQKHIAERNALVEEQLRDQVVRTTLEEHLTRKRPAEEASPIVTSPPNLRQREPRTPEDKIRTTSGTEMEETDSDITYSDEEPSETFLSQQSYTNTTKADSSLALAKEVEKEEKQTSKYINRDIASEALGTYQMNVLAGKKLIYNNVDVLDSARLNMKTTKKSPLCIGVINIHNSDCTKFLPDDFKHFVADQLQDPEIEAVNFANGRSISKFVVDCEEVVIQFLDKFYDVDDLGSLAKVLNENPIDMSVASNDLIFVRALFDHFFLLYKNDILLQSMSESELNMYVWTPLLRNAFLGKDDIKLSCGELASNSYNKLKEILNIGGRSAPRLDGKGLLKSLGTEILAQEDGVLNTRGKRKGDLKKLEYCTKVILTTLFFALPSEAKANIIKIETYSIQSNGLRLTISVSKYLFENTIITMDLQDIEIPRTVEGFSKLVVAVKVRGNETPSDWKKRIWDTLMSYRKNHLLTDPNKRYLIARKPKYLYTCDIWFGHWRTNCNGNEYCDMSFKDYMKLKGNPPPCYFTKKAIHRYEIWLENVSSRIRCIRQKQLRDTEHKVQSNVNTVLSKPHYICNQQKNICMNNTFLTSSPFPKKPIQYQRYCSPLGNYWMNESRSLTPPPLP
ncbi:18855_t:CDS:2 [Funneliformis geosporum]|nr:18855_t:CDS:2 [Funneliformis geosporum]